MSKELVRMMLFRAGHVPDVLRMEPTLANFQRLVDGYIETFSLGMSLPGGGRILGVCNEEGLLRRLPPNRMRPPPWGDVLVGDFMVCRYGADGTEVDMTDEDVRRVLAFFGETRISAAPPPRKDRPDDPR